MGKQDSSSSSSFPPGLHATLKAQKNAICPPLITQIQGLESNLFKAQTDWRRKLASEVQPESHVFKKKGNEQQFTSTGK